jgi:hypothetical protein
LLIAVLQSTSVKGARCGVAHADRDALDEKPSELRADLDGECDCCAAA